MTCLDQVFRFPWRNTKDKSRVPQQADVSFSQTGHPDLSWEFNPWNRANSGGQGESADPPIGLDGILSTIWRDKETRELLCNLQGHDAQLIINYLYFVLSKPVLLDQWLRRHCTIALYKLCKASHLYPHHYMFNESIVLGHRQPSNGSFSDIYKGRFGEKELCFKQLRLFNSDLNKALKAYAKEAILWGQMHHPNVASLYGIYYLNQSLEQICLVSPWMQYGNLVEYLKDRPSVSRVLFVYDVVAGLGYLHEWGLIHSDMKGANILVNDMEQACIADFGFSFIRTDESLSHRIETSTGHGFTQRWAAPELLDDNSRPTMGSDIWALGCVCLEILTGNIPYYGKTDNQIIKALMSRKPPMRPTPSLTNQRDNNIVWKEVDRCWNVNPSKRPKCQDILLRLEQAGISRGENGAAQHDVEQEIQGIRSALQRDQGEPVDLQAVKDVLDKVRK